MCSCRNITPECSGFLLPGTLTVSLALGTIFGSLFLFLEYMISAWIIYVITGSLCLLTSFCIFDHVLYYILICKCVCCLLTSLMTVENLISYHYLSWPSPSISIPQLLVNQILVYIKAMKRSPIDGSSRVIWSRFNVWTSVPFVSLCLIVYLSKAIPPPPICAHCIYRSVRLINVSHKSIK